MLPLTLQAYAEANATQQTLLRLDVLHSVLAQPAHQLLQDTAGTTNGTEGENGEKHHAHAHRLALRAALQVSRFA